jgi:HAMP domain-containing protein
MALSTKERDQLPASDFAVPGKRKLPMHDAHHLRLAWSQVGRTGGLTEAERKEARERIKRRAAELGIDTSDWETIHAMRLEAMALELPDVSDHPNRMPFSGVLVKLEQSSDAAPHGSKGKKIIMSREAAEQALPSLLGMGVDITSDFDGHDAQQKIGVITAATIEGFDLKIEGFIYAADFPEEAAFIKDHKDALGFSFEAQEIHVESLDSAPLVITACVFTGAAILLKDKAAFTTTSLAAAAAGELEMTKEELEGLLASALKPITDKIDAIEAGQAKLDEKIEAGKELHAKVAPHADQLRACASSMQAAGVGLHATRGHVAVLNRMADNLEAEAMAGSMPHIYRDHDYAGGSYYAGADKEAGKTDDATAKEIGELKASIADLTNKLKDGISAARDNAKEPERKTVSPQIASLLAKAGVDQPEEGKKLSNGDLDKVLASAGMSVSQRMVVKQQMYRDGLIDA